jgi:hypothetical protein
MRITNRMFWKNITSKTASDLSDDFLRFLSWVEQTHPKLPEAVINACARFAEFDVDGGNFDLLQKRFNVVITLGRNSSGLESFQLRYGDIVGKQKFEAKTSLCNPTDDVYKKTHGEAKLIEKKKNTSRGIEHFISKYGEEVGKIKHAEHWKEAKQYFGSSKEHFIRKSGTELGEERYAEFQESCSKHSSGESWEDKNAWREMVNKRNAKLASLKYSRDNTSLKSFVSRHGEVDGLDRYIACVENRQVKVATASKESLKIFIPLYKWVRRNIPNINKGDIYLGIKGSQEYYISKPRRFMSYDFCIPKLKIIIEFNGVAWHVKDSDTEIDLKRFARISTVEEMQESLQKDVFKLESAKTIGFNTLVVWSDICYNTTLEKCKLFIKEAYAENK